jgi:hypothetical protein
VEGEYNADVVGDIFVIKPPAVIGIIPGVPRYIPGIFPPFPDAEGCGLNLIVATTSSSISGLYRIGFVPA